MSGVPSRRDIAHGDIHQAAHGGHRVPCEPSAQAIGCGGRRTVPRRGEPAPGTTRHRRVRPRPRRRPGSRHVGRRSSPGASSSSPVRCATIPVTSPRTSMTVTCVGDVGPPVARPHRSHEGDPAVDPDADPGDRVTGCSRGFDGDEERPDRPSRVVGEHHDGRRRRVRHVEAGRQGRERRRFGPRIGIRHGDQEALERSLRRRRARRGDGDLGGPGRARASDRQRHAQDQGSERGQRPFHEATLALRGPPHALPSHSDTRPHPI